MKTHFPLAVLLFTLTLSHAAPARYFRADSGIAPDVSGPIPVDFESGQNRLWRQALDTGHSTPVIAGNKLFLTTFDLKSKQLATVALDLKSGQEVWKKVAPAKTIEPFHRVGSPAAATPACDGQRLYSFFGSYGMICYDLDGREIWSRPMGPFQDEFGAGSSPVLYKDRIYLNQDHDVGSFLMAIDATNGKTLWKTPRPDAVRSYATPFVWERDGKPEILVPGALQLSSYDPENGKPLWWVNGLARIVIPVPVAGPDMLYMASWAPGGGTRSRISMEPWADALSQWDANKDGKIAKSELSEGPVLIRFFRMDTDQNDALDQAEWERHAAVFRRSQNAVLALKPRGRGDLTESAVVWKYERGAPYVSSPLLHDGILWMVKDGGLVTKLETATGKLIHQERLPGLGNYYASPVLADNKVFFASEQGVVSVVAAQKEWKVIDSHDFDENIYASPVVHRDRIYIRTERALYCYGGRQ